MSGDPDIADSSLMAYDINGAQFIVQPLGNAAEAQGILRQPEDQENAVTFVSKMEDNKGDGESIPLVCLDGRAYVIRDGVLQALDISQLEYERAIHSDEGKSFVISQGTENDEKNCAQITKYLVDGEASPSRDDESQDLETAFDENDRFYVVAKDCIDANDFVEVVAAFKCKICPYTTQDREQLVKHFENVHANPATKIQPSKTEKTDQVKLMYMCGECSNCFPSMEACREHMILDHQLMDREGDEADNNFSIDSKKPLPNFKPSILGPRRPKSPTTENKIVVPKVESASCTKDEITSDSDNCDFKCTFRGCFHKFTTNTKMEQHAACHLDVPNRLNIYKCNICRDLKFPKWKPCSLHLWKRHQIDVDLYSCKICKIYKSVTLVKLLTHMRVHSDNREFECPECGKRFKQASQLRNHRVVHLDRKSSEIPRWYTSKTCDLCGKIYADSKCLKNHIQAVHSKLRPYVCNVCGHSSARKAMLQMHLRQHTGDKPFNCELCDYKTGDHNSLRRHMMRHTGVRPYKCPHCPYSAIQSNSYKNHLRSKHPSMSGLFTCDLCPFKTVKNESYLQHVGDHQKGLIKTIAPKNDDENVQVFPGNIAAAQLIYSCLGAYSKVGKTIEASLMSSSTSADGTSQTITIQIPSKHLEDSLPMSDGATTKNNLAIEQEDDETMHCFLKIPREQEENMDTGGKTIPAEPEEDNSTRIVVSS